MSSKSGVKTDAFANSGRANALYGNLLSQASNIYGGLTSTLQAEAAHPQGFTPQAKAAMNTAAQQSAGGSAAGAIGAGKLYSTRTKNAGGAKAAIGEGVRAAGGNLSNAALGTEIADANLQAKQQQAGIGGLSDLYGRELSGAEGGLGLSNQALGIANNAKPTFWQQFAQTAGKDVLGALTGQ